MLDGKRRYRGTWPPADSIYTQWCGAVSGPPAKFLDATISILWNLPTPADVRIRLEDQLVKGLTGPDDAQRRGIPPAEIRSMTGWSHYRLARFWAERDDRANVLKHTRLALAFAPQTSASIRSRTTPSSRPGTTKRISSASMPSSPSHERG